MATRLHATLAVGFALALVCAGSAPAAVQISFDGEVLRFRARPLDVSHVRVGLRPSAEPPHFRIQVGFMPWDPPVELGPGCARAGVTELVRCPLGSVPTEQLRYRFTLGSGYFSFETGLRGVAYGGNHSEFVTGGDRVYGGPGNDDLRGTRVYAGPGDDWLSAKEVRTGTVVLKGGPGHDGLFYGGLQYGGPGNDQVSDTDVEQSGDNMLVGGPGRDFAVLARDHRSDVVRVRGGGVDHVHCRKHPDPGDALFVDRTDRLSPSCKKATVLYTGRPRYPYP